MKTRSLMLMKFMYENQHIFDFHSVGMDFSITDKKGSVLFMCYRKGDWRYYVRDYSLQKTYENIGTVISVLKLIKNTDVFKNMTKILS